MNVRKTVSQFNAFSQYVKQKKDHSFIQRVKTFFKNPFPSTRLNI